MARISYYLDTRRTKDQPAPLRIAIRNRGTVAYITMNEFILPSQWDENNGCLKSYPKNKKLEHPDKQRLDAFLKRHILDIEDIVRKMPYHLPASEIKKRIIFVLGGSEEPSPLFINIYNQHIEQSNLKHTTIMRYKDTLNCMTKYSSSLGSITLDDIDENWLISFRKFMTKRGISNNTQVFRFSHIKATYIWAIKHGITTSNPFINFEMRTIDTEKRSLLPHQLHQLFTLDLSPIYPGEGRRSRIQTYIDLFKLIFFLRGISFVDLCNLTKSSYHNGRIIYNRSKTTTFYDIKVEPEADELIEKYKGKKHLLFILDENKEYTTYLKTVNDNLKKLGIYKGKGKPIFPGLTTYWARHSWATAAAELDLPIETISAGLGHKIGSRITSIYIRFNQKKVDEANRQIIDYILNYK